jgi:siroheme synthase
VLYMGLGQLDGTLLALIASGRSPETPAAIVANAGREGTRTVVGSLATLGANARREGVESPAVVIIGEVVARAVPSPPASEYLPATTVVARDGR